MDVSLARGHHFHCWPCWMMINYNTATCNDFYHSWLVVLLERPLLETLDSCVHCLLIHWIPIMLLIEKPLVFSCHWTLTQSLQIIFNKLVVADIQRWNWIMILACYRSSQDSHNYSANESTTSHWLRYPASSIQCRPVSSRWIIYFNQSRCHLRRLDLGEHWMGTLAAWELPFSNAWTSSVERGSKRRHPTHFRTAWIILALICFQSLANTCKPITLDEGFNEHPANSTCLMPALFSSNLVRFLNRLHLCIVILPSVYHVNSTVY